MENKPNSSKKEKDFISNQLLKRGKNEKLFQEKSNRDGERLVSKNKIRNINILMLSEKLVNVGVTLLETNKLKEAEASFKQAISLNPSSFEAHYNLGIVLVSVGRLEEAEAKFRKAIELNYDHAETHNNLGITLKALDKLEEATKSYKQAVNLKPDYAEAYNNLGFTLTEMKKLEEAEPYLRKAISLNPNFALAHNNLGVLLIEIGKFDEAKVSCSQAILLNPAFVEAHNNLGSINLQMGKYEEAACSYINAININPDFRIGWLNIYYILQILEFIKNKDNDYLSEILKKIDPKINDLELLMLQYRVTLGGKNAENSFDELTNIFLNKENFKIKNPKQPENILNRNEVLQKNMIGLLHFGRSGTGLLHSLIDNHSEVSTLPSIYFSEFFDTSNWDRITAGGWEDIINRFVDSYPVLFDARSSYPVPSNNNQFLSNLGINEGMTNLGANKDEFLSVDKALFKKELSYLMGQCDNIDQLTFFKLIHIAYEKANNNKHKKNTIFYHIHNPDVNALVNFISAAPNTKWVTMVREPVQCAESWFSKPFKNDNYREISNGLKRLLLDVNKNIFKNKDAIGVRLEDLKAKPKATIKALCNWMGIKEESSLYEMTAQGKKWWGDATCPKNMPPFGDMPKSKGLVFSKNDRFIINTLFYPFKVKFGYTEEDPEQFKKDLAEIRPMLDQMFDIEKEIIRRKETDEEQFMKSSAFLYLRTRMIERWQVLNEYHTYPNMLKPLKIKLNS